MIEILEYDIESLEVEIKVAVNAVRTIQAVVGGIEVFCNNPGDQPDGDGVWPPSRPPTVEEIMAIEVVVSAHNPLNVWKAVAIESVRTQAVASESRIPGISILTRTPGRARLLGDEVVAYYDAGRPVDPSANIYVVSSGLAIQKEMTLRDTLELLFAKYRAAQTGIRDILIEQERLESAIAAVANDSPTGVAEIEAILSGMNFP